MLVLLAAATADAAKVKLYILHVNDVYEMQGVAGGKSGGLGRVARLAAELRDRYGRERVITILSGDVLSPSGAGAILRDGGMHMIELMNVDAGGAPAIELAVFGNHELDVTPEQFEADMKASATRWLSANVMLSAPYAPREVPKSIAFTRTIDGVSVPIVVTGVTITSNQPPGVSYTDPLPALFHEVDSIDHHAVVIGMTHIDRVDDVSAARHPGIDLITGGHDHNASFDDPNGRCTGSMEAGVVRCTPKAGQANAPVFKADSNARTYWLHEVTWDSDAQRVVKLESHFHALTGPIGPRSEQVIDTTMQRLETMPDLHRAFGSHKLTDTLAHAPAFLDGREICARDIHCEDDGRMNQLIGRALACASKETQKADLVMYNAGLVRIDDVIPKGAAITPLDVLRICPFANTVLVYPMSGTKLNEVLEASRTKCVGNVTGCRLHVFGPQTIDPSRTYDVVLPSFLLSGREQVIGAMLRDDAAAQKPGPDLRAAIVNVLTERCEAKVK